MSTTTEPVPAGHRIEQWMARFRSSYPMELRMVPGQPLAIELEVRPVGAVAGSWTVSSGLRSLRTAEHVRAFDPRFFVLYIVVSGGLTLAAGGEASRLEPGDLAVISSSEPYEMIPHGRHEALSFTVPRGLLGRHAEALDALANRRVEDPIAQAVVVPALTRLGQAVQDGDIGAADADFGELVVSLARTLAADRRGRLGEGGGDRGAALLAQAKAYIETRLQDPDLRPGEVARAQFISVRYLQKLFQAEGLTMLEWLRTARLVHARRDLADASQAHRTVAEIASAWGFRHPGNFRRAFRAEFGLTPTQFRRSTLHAPSWTDECGASSGV
jgi:AraC-like DNA-binding protein